MKLYPESASVQLEFEKIKSLLANYTKTVHGKTKAENLRIHTKKAYIDVELNQTNEFALLLKQAQYFPNNFFQNIAKEIKLLSVPGATLSSDQFLSVKKLAENAEKIFRWFDAERRLAYPFLTKIVEDSYYEKTIIELIDEVLEENGYVKDKASEELFKIRVQLYKKRNELRRVFEKVVAKLNKAGYTADIEESFSSGRRVVAVFAEHKRQVKGILHGESDSRKTAFIEPEETIQLNNEVYALENDESREVAKVLRQLTASLSVYSNVLNDYLTIAGEFDFIEAKAKLANSMQAHLPNVVDKAIISLKQAYHPLLYLYNAAVQKTTVPTEVHLNDKNRILIISGPNAGGKTVTMKTVGLIQMMVQSGLLVPVHPTSSVGIFKQLYIHIGDTQSIEFELSTYSSHLLHMKHFIENANGKTLFFIDELGSGSDPNLGGAFAEVILEELCKKHAMGIVTTHYLNLKLMANHTNGIVNGAMAFDEKNLKPLYQLIVGKPGSSYTFSIAERIGLPMHLIQKAKKLVDDNHFKLDKLLNRTEQDLHRLAQEKQTVEKLIKENERLRKEMEKVIAKEKHQQQIELLKHQNKIAEEKWNYLKDMERKIKQIVLEWKKAKDKKEAYELIEQLLFKKKEQVVLNKLQKKVNAEYEEVSQTISIGSTVKLKKNHQVGIVKEIRSKRAIVQIGLLPMSVEIKDLVAVKKKSSTENQ